MTSEVLTYNLGSSKQRQATQKPSPASINSRMEAIATVVFAALFAGSLISSTPTFGDESADKLVSYLQISSLLAIFISIFSSKCASQSEPSQEPEKNSYLQAYPKEIASRIEKREKLVLDPYKEDFRNLVSLLVSPDLSLEEAELLLHHIAAIEPEKRKEASHLHCALSSRAKPNGCPFQHIRALPTFSNDLLPILEALKLHRFEEKVFKNPNSGETELEIFQQKSSVIACNPSDTPRYRKIFFDLLLNKKREQLLQSIIQDHFDPLFEMPPQDPEDSIDHLLEASCYEQPDVFDLTASLRESLRKIASSILDEIPIDWIAIPPTLNLTKLSESQLYQDLMDAGYTHEEIVTNLRFLAGVVEQNGKIFLSTLLAHLQKYEQHAQGPLTKIRQDILKQIKSGSDIWNAISQVKEIDMIILESLRMSNSLPPMTRTMLDSDKTIEILPDILAKRSDLVGEKPDEFRPTRLIEGSNKQISQYWPSAVSWMPFGHGVHLCLGWRLYQMMSRYVVAKVALSDLNQ